ncbi:MAG: hypothetical protein NVSMB38_37930 [Ktedonobacteraceae bacterium]
MKEQRHEDQMKGYTWINEKMEKIASLIDTKFESNTEYIKCEVKNLNEKMDKATSKADEVAKYIVDSRWEKWGIAIAAVGTILTAGFGIFNYIALTFIHKEDCTHI